jgi:hypothetical protein
MNLASTNLNQHLMQQMGIVIATNPRLVADLLEANEVNLDLAKTLEPLDLTDCYLQNLPQNDSLKLGSAYLVNRFEESAFDGDVDNDTIRKYYEAIDDYWSFDEDYSYIDPVTAVAGALGSGAELGKSLVEAKRKKKFFGSDLAEKQASSRQAMIQGILTKKKEESDLRKKEQDAKTKRTIIIASVVGAGLLIGVIVFLRLRKNG